MSDLPHRRPTPAPDGTSGALTTSRPDNFVEVDTSPEPTPQRDGLFSALAPPTLPSPRTPRELRRPRTVVIMPLWLLAGLGILAAIAGLLLVPALSPWRKGPVQSPLDEAAPGVEVIGTEAPGASVGPGAGPDATATTAATGSPDPTAGVSASATPSNPGDGPPPGGPPPLEIAQFSATPVLVVGGYDISVTITNPAAGPQRWRSVSVYVNGPLPPGSVTVQRPAVGARGYVSEGRACVSPTGSGVANLDAGQTLTISFRIGVALAQAPGAARVDHDGCVPPPQS